MADVAKIKTETPAGEKKAVSRRAAAFEEMEQFFNNMWNNSLKRMPHLEWPSLSHFPRPFETAMPKVDVIERDHEIVVRAEVPGYDKDDLDITTTEDSLCLSGRHEHEEKEEQGNYYRSEISRESFSRTIRLPAAVDGAKAKASYKDGVLELTLPRVSQSERHQIKLD